VRDPQPGLPWSTGRVRARAKYCDYMGSPDWQARRRTWHAAWIDRHGTRPTCQAYDEPWALSRGDLHHRTYARLGAELFDDLVPLCRADHAALHDILDTAAGWRHLGRPAATAGIVAILRRLHHADAAELGQLW
jgi:hypothetical protein